MGVVCFLDEGGDFIYKWAGGGGGCPIVEALVLVGEGVRKKL